MDEKMIEITETFSIDVTFISKVPAYMEKINNSKDRLDWLNLVYGANGADDTKVTNHKVFVRELDREVDDGV